MPISKKFKHYKQLDSFDCGPTCLQMVAKHHGKFYALPFLRDISYLTNVGVSAAGIVEAAERIGFRTVVTKLNFEKMGGG